jgi:flagellar biosynthesis protein FlhG
MGQILENVFLSSEVPRTVGPVIAIASGKGGVGKTALSCAIAGALSRHGERTLIIDADLGMANVDVQLGLHTRGDLSSVVAGRINFAEAISPVQSGSEKPGGFDVVAGPSGSGMLTSLDNNSVGRLAAGITAASLDYDRTIIDLAAGAERSNIRLAAAADDVVMVINDEPTSLTDAYAFIKTLRMRDEGASPFVLVTNCETEKAGRAAYESLAQTCDSFLGFKPPLIGQVCRDPHIADSIRAQTPIGVRYPNCPALKDITRIVAKLENGVSSG